MIQSTLNKNKTTIEINSTVNVLNRGNKIQIDNNTVENFLEPAYGLYTYGKYQLIPCREIRIKGNDYEYCYQLNAESVEKLNQQLKESIIEGMVVVGFVKNENKAKEVLEDFVNGPNATPDTMWTFLGCSLDGAKGFIASWGEMFRHPFTMLTGVPILFGTVADDLINDEPSEGMKDAAAFAYKGTLAMKQICYRENIRQWMIEYKQLQHFVSGNLPCQFRKGISSCKLTNFADVSN